MVWRGVLSVRPSGVYFRSGNASGPLLCAGCVVDVCGACGYAIIRHSYAGTAGATVALSRCLCRSGGKTSAAIGALPVGSLVVANEYDFRRAEILKENVVKWGYPDVVVSRGDTSRFRSLPVFFDVVAADVPCSGEGMMRKDDTACRQWSRGLVEECAMRQKEIVANLWRTLRPGGFMIYSTCTFNRRENEDMMEWLVGDLGAEKVAVHFASDWGVVDTGLMLRFLPSELRGEGLAIGVVRKPLEGFIEGDSAGEEPRSWKRVPLKNNLRRDGKEKSGGRGGGFDAASLRKSAVIGSTVM